MTLNNDPRQYPFVFEPAFVQLINTMLEERVNDVPDGAVINFRDPT